MKRAFRLVVTVALFSIIVVALILFPSHIGGKWTLPAIAIVLIGMRLIVKGRLTLIAFLALPVMFLLGYSYGGSQGLIPEQIKHSGTWIVNAIDSLEEARLKATTNANLVGDYPKWLFSEKPNAQPLGKHEVKLTPVATLQPQNKPTPTLGAEVTLCKAGLVVQIINPRANLRDSYSLEAQKITVIEGKPQVTVFEVKDDWAHIEINEKQGWMSNINLAPYTCEAVN